MFAGSVDRLNTGNSRLRVFSPIKGEKIEEELLNVSNHTEGRTEKLCGN